MDNKDYITSHKTKVYDPKPKIYTSSKTMTPGNEVSNKICQAQDKHKEEVSLAFSPTGFSFKYS